MFAGTRAGHLELWELGSGTIVEKIQAHDGPVWSLDILPDKKGFVSGGGDKEVKVWDFEISLEAGSKAKQLNLVQARSLKTGEEVLCVKCSPVVPGLSLCLGVACSPFCLSCLFVCISYSSCFFLPRMGDTWLSGCLTALSKSFI